MNTVLFNAVWVIFAFPAGLVTSIVRWLMGDCWLSSLIKSIVKLNPAFAQSIIVSNEVVLEMLMTASFFFWITLIGAYIRGNI